MRAAARLAVLLWVTLTAPAPAGVAGTRGVIHGGRGVRSRRTVNRGAGGGGVSSQQGRIPRIAEV